MWKRGVYCMKFYAYRNGVKGVKKFCFRSWAVNLILTEPLNGNNLQKWKWQPGPLWGLQSPRRHSSLGLTSRPFERWKHESGKWRHQFYFWVYTLNSWKQGQELIFIQLYLLLLSRFSRIWLCATPWTSASQASAISLSLLKLMSILWAGLSQKTLAGRGLELYAYINLEKGIFLSFPKFLWLQLAHKDSCPSMILTGSHLGPSCVCSPHAYSLLQSIFEELFLPASQS